MKYKAYKEKDSTRRTRKASRKAVFAFNSDLHSNRAKKEAKAKLVA